MPTPPPARGVAVRDAVAARIAEIWEPAAPDAVAATQTPDVCSAEEAEALPGRQVRVSLVGQQQVQKLDRGASLWEYRLLVLVVERCADAGALADAWVTPRLDFVAGLVEKLGDETAPFLLGSVWPFAADWAVPCDMDVLREHKLFWSAFELALREAR